MFSTPAHARFRSENDLNHRKLLSQKILSKFPNCIPLIIGVAKNSRFPELSRYKYLVPKELTISKLLLSVRMEISMDPHSALFLMVNNRICIPSSVIGELYQQFKDQDGFLFVTVCKESVFGSHL